MPKTKSTLLTTTVLLSLAGYAVATEPVDGNDLEAELVKYASKSNLDILFNPRVVKNLKAGPYSADGSSREVLKLMLAGTGLRAKETAPNVFVISFADALSTKALTEEESTSGQVSVAGKRQGDFAPGVVQGSVVDAATGKPLTGALVTIKALNIKTRTDSRGEYRFSAVPPGEYIVEIDYLGSKTKSIVVEVEPGETSKSDLTVSSTMEEIIVIGAQANRSSLARALNEQRAADNASTVVAADLLGSFPAENVAEALRRVSGVTFERDPDTGKGARVSIRGFNSEAINVQLNGLELQGTGIERSIDLTGVQGDNISKITIQKTLLPSHEATGTGGQVEIETKTALDYGDRYLNVGIEREFGEQSAFGDEYDFNVTAAWSFTEDFAVSGTVQYRDTGRANFNANLSAINTPVLPAGITSAFRIPESFNFPFDPELPGRLLFGSNYIFQDRDESNFTGSFNAALNFSDETSLRFDFQRIKREQELTNRRSTQSFLTSRTALPIPELGGEVRTRSYLTGLRPTLGITEQQSDDTTTIISFRGDTDINQWEFDYKVGYSKTERARQRSDVSFTSSSRTNLTELIDPSTIVINPDDNAAQTPRVVNGGVVLVGDTIPVLSLTPLGLDVVNDPATYSVLFASRAQSVNPSESYTTELSGRYNFADSLVNYVEVGGKYTSSERANSDDVLSNTNLTSSQSFIRIFGRDTFLPDLLPDGLEQVSLGAFGPSEFSVPQVGLGSADLLLDQIANLVTDDPSTPENEERFRLTDRTGDPVENSGAISPATIQEDRLALYVQTKATIGDVEVITGARVEQLKTNGNAIFSPSIITDATGSEPRQTFVDAGLIQFVDTGGKEHTLTPTLIANYRPSDNWVGRFGYFRSTINPNIRQIIRPPQAFIDLRASRNRATLREANPDLKPTVTDNFDIDVSYYFKDNPGLVRMAVFYKKVRNNFSNLLLADESVSDDLQARILALLAPLQATRPDLLAFNDQTEYFLNRPVNGEGGISYGFEGEVIRQVDFLPDSWPKFLSNFTLLGNITWTETDFPTNVSARDDAGDAITLTLDRPLAGQSEWAGNASVSYEDSGFSGRLIYTYQSESVTIFDEHNLNAVIPEFDTLDLRMSYTFDNDWGTTTLFFEGDNLLNGPGTADIRTGFGSVLGEGSPDFFFPNSVQFNGGRTFTIGTRVRF